MENLYINYWTFFSIATDQDFAKIIDCTEKDIEYARDWFLVNYADCNWGYNPSYGELIYSYPIESENYTPILNAISVAEDRDLLEHSRYKDAITMLKEIVKVEIA